MASGGRRRAELFPKADHAGRLCGTDADRGACHIGNPHRPDGACLGTGHAPPPVGGAGAVSRVWLPRRLPGPARLTQQPPPLRIHRRRLPTANVAHSQECKTSRLRNLAHTAATPPAAPAYGPFRLAAGERVAGVPGGPRRAQAEVSQRGTTRRAYPIAWASPRHQRRSPLRALPNGAGRRAPTGRSRRGRATPPSAGPLADAVSRERDGGVAARSAEQLLA